jgi:PII-like signaling protein
MKRYLGKKKLMRIYLDNSDTHEGKPLWQVLLQKVQKEGMAGATVFKAAAGIGAETELHTFEIWSMAQKLPVVIEIIEEEERIREFLDKYDSMIGEGLVTLWDVEVLRYKNAVQERN